MLGTLFERSFLMKKLGCATLLMVLLVLACLWKAGMLEAQGRAPTQTNPAIPASCVAVGQPRSDPPHSGQLVRWGTQFQVVGRGNQGPPYVTAPRPWFSPGTTASLP